MVEEGAFRPQIKIDFIEDALKDVPKRGWEESRIVEKIPLPTHLPLKLDLSALPENVQKSGAIDSLIRQNEDLMARLNVALRRHSILEEQAGKFENTLKQLQDRNEALADQVLVYREKDRLQGNTRKTSERQIQELKEQVSLFRNSATLSTMLFLEKNWTISPQKLNEQQDDLPDIKATELESID
ncbi:MAG: hypothetical protein IPJ71_02425 [Bdellovibrionales bacterium]|nr:hypothetical protein [Bdellovibrionales bacterium]